MKSRSGISGISPEYFIKPDPLLTRQETRHYIRAGLRSFLTGPALLRDAQALMDSVVDLEDLKTGLWPAGRLVALARLLETDDLADVGAVALAICQSHLDVSEDLERFHGRDTDAVTEGGSDRGSEEGSEDAASDDEEASPAVTETDSQEHAESAEINHVAQGFILTDLLPNGKTIRPYWDHSPCVALRTAPPLGSTGGSVRPSIDDLLEEAHQRFWRGVYSVCNGLGIIVPAACVGYLAYKMVG
jgi:hypothetical protein